MSDFRHIEIRRGTTADWARADPVLKLGEIAADTTLHRLKVGDGSKKWSELDWYGGGGMDIIDNLTSDRADAALSAAQGKELKRQIDNLPTGGSDIEIVDNLTSDDKTAALSAAQGKELKRQIDNVANGGVTVVDDLKSSSTTSALSANQGRILQSNIDTLSGKVDDFKNVEVVNSLSSDSTTAALSAAQGKELQRQINNLPTGGGGSDVAVIDNLESTQTDAALSANQGRVLNEKVKGLGIFGMGYEVTELNNMSRPTKIKFEDGVTCELTWNDEQLRKITASTGEVMTINYSVRGTIIGRTITRP